MARRRRLTPGESRLLEHYVAHPHGVRLHGRLEPLTPQVAHELAPTVVPAPPVPAGVSGNRYGAIFGGALGNIPAQTQYEMNPTQAAAGAVTAPNGLPQSVVDALRNTGILGQVEKLRLKRIAESEPIHPDVLAETIGTTLLTAGLGGLAGVGRGGAAAVEGAVSGAAEQAAPRSAAQIVADAARAVRGAPQAAREGVESLATRAGQRAAAERAAGGAADFVLEHPKLSQVGGLGAVGAATGQRQGGLAIPTALVQGTARALEPAHIGNTAVATGRGLAGAITGPAALGYSAIDSAVHGNPNPFLNTAKGQGEGILDIFGKLLSGNADTVQQATENEVGLSLLPLLPHGLGSDLYRDRVRTPIRDVAKDARGAINRRFGADLRYSPEEQNVFGFTQRRQQRRATAEEAQRASEPQNAIGQLEGRTLERHARKIAGSRRLSNLGDLAGEDLIQTLADTGIRDARHVPLVRDRLPARNEDALPRDVTLHRVLDHIEQNPELLHDPALLSALDEYRGIQERTPHFADEKGLRASRLTQAHIFGVRDAVERIPKAVESLLPDLGTGKSWSRAQAWHYVKAGEDHLRELRSAANHAVAESRTTAAVVRELERDERRRQSAAGGRVVRTDAPRRTDLPRSDGQVVRPGTKTRGPLTGERRLEESARLQREKAKLVQLQAEARGKSAEAKALGRHLETIKRGPGGRGGLNEFTRPWHEVSSRARRKLWSPEMVREMAAETDAAAKTFGFDTGVYTKHGEAVGAAEKGAGPRGRNIRATAVPHVRANPADERSLAARDAVARDFASLVEGSIREPRRQAGLRDFTRRFIARHAIELKVKLKDGTEARKTRMTFEQYNKAVREGQLSGHDHIWVPESEYKQPFLQANQLEDTRQADIGAGIEQTAAAKDPGSYGVVLDKERWEEHNAQVDPARGLAERITNLLSKGAGRMLLFSPAWIETQAVAELLPMVMAHPRLILDPTYAARLAKQLRDASELDMNAHRSWAAVVGEAPVRTASARELAPGYQSRSHGMFSEAARALERTLPGRAMLSTVQLRPFIIFDQWRQGKYRQILAAAELDKQLNGTLVNLGKALRNQRGISDELRGRPLSEAITELGSNPRYKRLLDEQYGYLNDVMGNWTAFTRFERKFGPAAIFYGFLRYAMRWPLTFARRHPISAEINYFLAQQNANQLEKMLHGKPASFFQYANPVVQNAEGESEELPVGSRISPGLSPVTTGALEQNAPAAAVGSLNPAYGALLGLITGTNSFGQHDEDTGPLGLHWSLAAKELMSTPPVARLLGVGSSHSQTSEELNENDPARKIRSFGAPWIPLPEDAARANNEIIKGVEEYEKAKEENGGYAPSSSSGNAWAGDSSASSNVWAGGGSSSSNAWAAR